MAPSCEPAVETKFHPGNPKHLAPAAYARGMRVLLRKEHSVAKILADSPGAYIDRLNSSRLLAMAVVTEDC